MDDAHTAEYRVVVDRNGVDAILLDRFGVPGLHTHLLEDPYGIATATPQ